MIGSAQHREVSRRPGIWAVAVLAALVGILFVTNALGQSAGGSMLTTRTWPAGTLISSFPNGGRIATYHRNHLYLGALARTSIYNINDPTNPTLINQLSVGENGHRWWKMGDIFWREYSQPEIKGSGYKYLNLSQMPSVGPWTGSAPLPIFDSQPSDLGTFPHGFHPWNNNAIVDMRTDRVVGNFDFSGQKIINGSITLRIGNLLFFTAETPNSGVAVFDIGNPANVRLLDVLQGDYFQYTTFYAVWRNYIVLTVGSDTNRGGNSVIAIDYSDPTNLTYAFGFPTAKATVGRYIFFQDEYGFVAANDRIAKINMETRTVETIPSPRPLPDFQVMPLGHLLIVSGSGAGNDDNTHIFAHQNGLDRRAPYVGHAVPANGARNQPLSTVIGLVINETLDDTTVNGQNIQIREVANGAVTGTALAVDVVSSQHNVINVAPRVPLQANTTYQIRIAANGIRDAAGNGINEYISYFSTGSTIETVTGGSNATPTPTVRPDSAAVTQPTIADPVPPVISQLAPNVSNVTAGSPIVFTANANHPNGAIQYRWNFGNESEQTQWTSSPQSQFTPTRPGQYSVLVQARVLASDGRYYVVSESQSFVVSSGVAAPPRDTRSTPIIIDSKSRLVWNVNPDSDTVTTIDPDTLRVVREITVGKRPVSVALDAAGQAWVACQDSDEIQIVSPSGLVVRRIALGRGSRPSAIVVSQDGLHAYVSEYATGRVRRFGTTSFTETGTVYVGPWPKAMALSTTGVLNVSRFISGDESGEIYRVRVADNLALIGKVPLPLDSKSADNGAGSRGLPNYIGGLALSPDQRDIWYVGKKDNILRGLKRDGQPRKHDALVRTLIGVVGTENSIEQVERRVDIDDRSMPSSVQVSPLGAHVFVTFQGNNRISALNARTGEELASADVGLAPQGIAIDATTNRVFVHDLLGRSVSVLDGAALMTRGRTELIPLAVVNTVAMELLAPEVLLGKRVFYNAADRRMALEGYISCASCHADGGDDGRVWDATDGGEGLRSTIPLRGRGGMAHGRIHWSANFDEIQDFERDIRRLFGGTGFTSDTQLADDPMDAPTSGKSRELDALAAYVSSLDKVAPSPHRASNGTLTSAGQKGRNLFRQFSCSTCHSGASFTDSAKGKLHDVGTLKSTSGTRLGAALTGMDTPTLVGLWEKSRYLHDGRATSIAAVLTDESASRHGRMGELNPKQRQDLEAYLLQIDGSEPPPVARPAAPTRISVE